MFSLTWDEKAFEELDKLEKSVSRRILIKIDALTEKMFSLDVKKLKGIDAYRLRVGDYRVIFEIEGNNVTIIKVGHRKDIYNF